MVSYDKDVSVSALKTKRFQMLQDIARELTGDVVFPVYFDLTLHVRKVLRDPRVSQEDLVWLLNLEPLLAVKVLRAANGGRDDLDGQQILDVESAIERLGSEAVRAAALKIAELQLRRSKEMATFGALARRLWEHSLMTAVAARVIARRMTSLNAEEAALAGLIHDLGAFYMLYRATQYPELCARPDTLSHLIIQWHESIGDSLLTALDMPASIRDAIRDHDEPRSAVVLPKTLNEVIFVANLLADGAFEWSRKDLEEAALRPELKNPDYLHLMGEIRSEYQAVRLPFEELI